MCEWCQGVMESSHYYYMCFQRSSEVCVRSSSHIRPAGSAQWRYGAGGWATLPGQSAGDNQRSLSAQIREHQTNQSCHLGNRKSALPHSNPPSLQPSLTSTLTHSNPPSLQPSLTPTHPHSNPPSLTPSIWSVLPHRSQPSSHKDLCKPDRALLRRP